VNTGKPTLFATVATLRAVERARAVVVLVGSYDGSGNYGDIAQLGAALDLVERLGPGIVALPVLERRHLADHRKLSAQGMDPSFPLFFDPEGELEDDLLPLAAPIELAFAATYLYGGGYLNRLWGARKLAMADAADSLLAAAGIASPYRLCSGLQVDPQWIAEIGDGGAAALRGCDLLGARDPGSRLALTGLSPKASAIETGDDAIGVLGQLPDSDDPPGDLDRLRVNVHFAPHGWVTERPRAVLDFYAELLGELGRLSGLPVLARPLLAYQDERIDELPAVERLRDACVGSGVEVAEPRLLRPSDLDALAPWLRQASLSVSCSYHVALTSLMLAVPALIVADNPYYEQKAAGLREAFDLPPVFISAATADPGARARELAATLFDRGRAGELRDALAAGAGRLRRRRADAETELLGRLGGAAAAAFSRHGDELAARLRQRSAEPAELRARLAEQQTELEELRQRAAASPLEAELRAQEAELRAREAERGAAAAHETLATVVHSRSWRLMAPLRRLGAPLRRRGG
jgi:hypothetical protein